MSDYTNPKSFLVHLQCMWVTRGPLLCTVGGARRCASCRRWPCVWAGRRIPPPLGRGAFRCGGGRGLLLAEEAGQQLVPDFLPDSDPVRAAARGHQSLQLVSAHKVRGTLVDPLWDPLQETQGDVPAITRGGGGSRGVWTV